MDLKLGLKAKTPWDGKKRDTTKVHFKDRIQAVHFTMRRETHLNHCKSN